MEVLNILYKINTKKMADKQNFNSNSNSNNKNKETSTPEFTNFKEYTLLKIIMIIYQS